MRRRILKTLFRSDIDKHGENDTVYVVISAAVMYVVLFILMFVIYIMVDIPVKIIYADI